MRIVTVVGARPQFIKASTVSRAISEYRSKSNKCKLEEIIIHTGQHYNDQMSKSFFQQLDIPAPATNLKVGSGLHGHQTGAMLQGLESEMIRLKPDLVLVYGDTNSTVAGALAASKLGIPVAHVEAGMRSFLFGMAEEQNRIVSDHLSTFLFCSTPTAVAHLSREGLIDGTAMGNGNSRVVRLVGDVMCDALRHQVEQQGEPNAHFAHLGLDENPFVLATIHRAENVDDPKRLARILQLLCLAPLPVVFPVHPRTKAMVDKYPELGAMIKGLIAIPPQDYGVSIALQRGAKFICTDSGGVQKEAYLLRKPCITFRPATEWVETVELGWNVLVDIDEDKVREAFHKVEMFSLESTDNAPFFNSSYVPTLYGDGRAAELIVYAILQASLQGVSVSTNQGIN